MRHSHAYYEIAYTDDACTIILLCVYIQSYVLTRCQSTYFQHSSSIEVVPHGNQSVFDQNKYQERKYSPLLATFKIQGKKSCLPTLWSQNSREYFCLSMQGSREYCSLLPTSIVQGKCFIPAAFLCSLFTFRLISRVLGKFQKFSQKFKVPLMRCVHRMYPSGFAFCTTTRFKHQFQMLQKFV